MRVLVTGAGGFCGRHLVDYLRSQRVEIYTIGPKVTSKNHYFSTPIDLKKIITAMINIRPDYVFHLAGVIYTKEYPLYYLVNTLYAANLMRALELAGFQDCPTLLTGTAAEYGFISNNKLPITEETEAIPYNHYGISKLAQTSMGITLAKSGRPLVMVRPFNIIGPGMSRYISVQSFARQIVDIIKGRHSPVIEIGNLSSSRDFVVIEDVIKIYWQLIQTPSAYGEVVNICSGRGVVLKELLDKFIAIANIQVEIRVDPTRLKPVDVPVHYGSPEKLRSILGSIPDTNLDAALQKILGELMRES